MGCTMRPWGHARALSLGLALLLGAAACGPDISSLTPEVEAQVAATQAPTVPLLLAEPGTDVDTAAPGEQITVTVTATAQRPLDTVTVALHDGAGRMAGDTWLVPVDAETWSGALAIPAGALPGTYALEVTLHDGPFDPGSSLVQTLYRFEPGASATNYRTYTNSVAVRADAFVVDPLPGAPPGPPLRKVQVQAP